MNLLSLYRSSRSTLFRVTLQVLLFLSLMTSSFGAHAFAASTSPALSFDGSSSVSIGSRFEVGYYTYGLTLSSWVKTTSTLDANSYDPAEPVFGDTTGAVGMQFGVSGGVAAYHVYDRGWKVIRGTIKVNDDKWHHISVTHNYSTLVVCIYVDGVLDAEGTSTVYGPGAIGSVGRAYGGVVFHGSLDDAQIWNRALTTAEITSLSMNLTSPDNNLMLWYKMDENTGSTLGSSATSIINTGTIVGTSTWVTRGVVAKVGVDTLIPLLTGHNNINSRLSIVNYDVPTSVKQSLVLPYAYSNAGGSK